MLWVLFCAGLVRADDNYVHTFTGFTFPPKVAEFTQVKITPFNDAHSDIEVDYNNDPYTVHLSVYVYPAREPLKQHYEECKDAVIRATSNAKLLEEKPITLDKSGVKYDGFSALFSFRAKFVGNQDQDILSKLIIFRRANYYVLFRISYALNAKETAEKQIDDFIQQFTWPTGDGTTSSSL